MAVDGRQLSAASVSVAASGALIAGVAGQIIRVYRMLIVNVTAVTVQFQDGATNLTGVMSLPATGILSYPMDGNPWFTTSPGNAFNIALGGAIQVSGSIYFTVTTSAGGVPL
jgi:hypothetical protein